MTRKLWFKFRQSAANLRAAPVIVLIEVIGIFAGVVGLYLTYFQLRSDALARSWDTLAVQVPFSSGKTSAIEYLVQRGQTLSGVDLSCLNMNGYRPDETGELVCATRPVLSGLTVSNASMWPVDFSETNLLGSSITRSDLRQSSFSGSFILNGDFSGSNLTASDFRGASLGVTRFRNTNLTAVDFTDATFGAYSVGGERISIEPEAQFAGAYAWDGFLPIGIPDGADVIVCETPKRLAFRQRPPITAVRGVECPPQN